MATENAVGTPDISSAPDGTKTLDAFNKVIANRENGTSELADSWHFLQLYSYWGIYLPNTEETLKLKLNIKNPGAFDFFTPMLQAYSGLHEASSNFVNVIFNKVVGLGNDLKSFAEKASTKDPDSSMFSAILACLEDGDTESSIELITDLQTTAAENAKTSGEVKDLLSAYKAKLADGSGKLTNVKASIEKNKATSQATINTLSGDKDAAGSLANLTKRIEESNDAYKHNVVVASTTVTYAWVIPFGLIAAAVVAGVFGDKAVKELKALDELRASLMTKTAELATAVSTQETQNAAQKGVDQALALTDSAIAHTSILQNAWNGLDKELGEIAKLLGMMTKTTDSGVVLKTKTVIKTYVKNAGAAWERAFTPLQQLTKNPYIKVENNEVTITNMAKDVQKALEAKN